MRKHFAHANEFVLRSCSVNWREPPRWWLAEGKSVMTFISMSTCASRGLGSWGDEQSSDVEDGGAG